MNERLLAIAVSRRCVAAAAFNGLTLECSFIRELSSQEGKAADSAKKFISWLRGVFPESTWALELPITRDDTRRAVLVKLVKVELAGERPRTVQTHEMFNAFGEPRLRTRLDLRRTVATIFPALNARSQHPATLDAAGVGLFVQTARLLNK